MPLSGKVLLLPLPAHDIPNFAQYNFIAKLLDFSGCVTVDSRKVAVSTFACLRGLFSHRQRHCWSVSSAITNLRQARGHQGRVHRRQAQRRNRGPVVLLGRHESSNIDRRRRWRHREGDLPGFVHRPQDRQGVPKPAACMRDGRAPEGRHHHPAEGGHRPAGLPDHQDERRHHHRRRPRRQHRRRRRRRP